MFFSISSKSRIYTVPFYVVVLFFALICFFGCEQPNLIEDSVITGIWNGSYAGEQYIITETTFKAINAYEGSDICIVESSKTAGIIFIKLTKAATEIWTYSDDPSQAPDVGKWYAIAYRNLASSSVEIAGAYKASEDGGKSSVPTLEEAKTEFTLDNGYFSYYSECTK